MNPTIKRAWIRALRLGKYKQGTMTLKKGNKFCCLGVLCDLYGKKMKTKWITGHFGDDAMLGEENDLPGKVIKWAGLSDRDPMLNAIRASQHNDGGKTFKQIAVLINKHL